MTEPIRFLGRQPRKTTPATPASRPSNMAGMIGAIHPSALVAMQQTGLPAPRQSSGRGSQHFLRGGLSAPMTVTWEITAACNIACVHCLSASGKRRPRELTTQQSLALVDELAEMQVFQVHFGGGEPFIYPGIWQVLERCRERGLVMCVSTNGTLITQERARRLAQLDPIYFQVSLDGGTPATNDRIRGQGVFHRAMRGLERLAAENLSLTVNSVLTRYSFDELDRLYEIAASFNAKLRVTRLRPSGRGQDVWDDLHPTREQYRAFTGWLEEHPDVLTADSVLPPQRFRSQTGGTGHLRRGNRDLLHLPGGEVYPAPSSRLPNLKQATCTNTAFRISGAIPPSSPSTATWAAAPVRLRPVQHLSRRLSRHQMVCATPPAYQRPGVRAFSLLLPPAAMASTSSA